MRFFELLNFQHVVMYAFPALVFMILFGLALGYRHFISETAEQRKKTVLYRFPENIEDRNAPFPLGLMLLIAGTVLWGFFYILCIGLFNVVI